MINRLRKWFRIQTDPVYKKPNARLTHLEKMLGFSIPEKDRQLFERALRHRSIVDHENYETFETYERLEFLGDAVLDLIVTEILFDRYPTENEGFLTKMRAKIVRGDTLYLLAKKLELSRFLEVGERAAGQGIELSKSVLSDAFEALTASIYISLGYKKAYQFVNDILDRSLNFEEIVTRIDNHKSILMEYSQSKKLNLPNYVVLSEQGPGHNKTFHVAVYIGKIKLGEGSGKSKKNAEQAAARNALKAIESK